MSLSARVVRELEQELKVLRSVRDAAIARIGALEVILKRLFGLLVVRRPATLGWPWNGGLNVIEISLGFDDRLIFRMEAQLGLADHRRRTGRRRPLGLRTGGNSSLCRGLGRLGGSLSRRRWLRVLACEGGR